jgi:hypothetical protein
MTDGEYAWNGDMCTSTPVCNFALNTAIGFLGSRLKIALQLLTDPCPSPTVETVVGRSEMPTKSDA